ncbi:MAG: hypothetical protein V5A24_01640 [Haloarculaceae archaeon]
MSDRGQLVLLAAAIIAVALVPVVTATMQLGYHPDGETRAVDPHPVTATEVVLDRAVADVAPDLPPRYSWADRESATSAVATALGPLTAAINRSRTAEGTVLAVARNRSRAEAWARAHCSEGPDRQFGECRAMDGIVLQERRGRAHLLAVAIDVRATGQGERWRASLVVRPR